MSKTYIKELRTKATESEKVFYYLIKDLGLHVVFQKLYYRLNKGHYYIDFQLKVNRKQLKELRLRKWPIKASKFVRHRLLIEIDGEYHNHQLSYDFQREQEILNRKGIIKYHFLRFTNHQILFNSQFVLEKLYAQCKNLWGIELQFEDVRNIMNDHQLKSIKVYNFSINS